MAGGPRATVCFRCDGQGALVTSFVGKRVGLCAVAPRGCWARLSSTRLLYSTLLSLSLLSFVQPVSADELTFSIDDVYSALSDSSRSTDTVGRSSGIIRPHHGTRDEDVSSLATYVRRLDTEQPQLISASGSSFHGNVYKDAAFSALREYAQQIGVEQAKLPNVEESDGARSARIDDADVLALHGYARQIGTDQPDAAGDVKIAEADNAFDALRDLLGRGAQPEAAPNTSPNSPPTRKGKPPAAPKRAKPAAPY